MRSIFPFCALLLLTFYADLHAQTPEPEAGASPKEAEMLQTAPAALPVLIPSAAQTAPLSSASGTVADPTQQADIPTGTSDPEGTTAQPTKRQFRKKAGNKNASDPERKMHWANIFSGVSAGVIIACLIALSQGGFFVLTSFFLTVPAIVIGIIGITRSGKDKAFKGKGWGIFGVVTGALVLLFYVLLFIALAALFS